MSYMCRTDRHNAELFFILHDSSILKDEKKLFSMSLESNSFTFKTKCFLVKTLLYITLIIKMHTIKLAILIISNCSLVALSMLTLLCNRSLELFYLAKLKCYNH